MAAFFQGEEVSKCSTLTHSPSFWPHGLFTLESQSTAVTSFTIPSKKGHIFLPNLIPAPMRVCVYTFAPSRMNRRYTFFNTLKIHLGDQRRAARDWLVADMSSESRGGCQGQQCEPLGYVLASALNGLMCRLSLCTRESSDSSQGCWEFCNILGPRAYLESTFAPFQFWWHLLALNLLWLALHITHWFVRRLSCDPCSDENNARICVFPHANSTQITNCRSCWHCSCCWLRSESSSAPSDAAATEEC